MMKSRRMRWAVHVAGMGEKMNACRILVRTLKERDDYEDLDLGRRIILSWIVEK
jgi:hypothetical protein